MIGALLFKPLTSLAVHQVGDSRDKMKLLIFFVFSAVLTISWAQRPTLYGAPPGDQETTSDQRGSKDSNFNPRGHGFHGRKSNGSPDGSQPPRLGADTGFGAPLTGASVVVSRDGASNGAPSFMPPKPPGAAPSVAF